MTNHRNNDESKTDLALKICCYLVDIEINQLSRQQVPSNSAHLLKVHTRATKIAAQKIINRAKSQSMQLKYYIRLSVAAANLTHGTRITIGTLAMDKIHKQVVERESYFRKHYFFNKSSAQKQDADSTFGSKDSIIYSIRLVMEAAQANQRIEMLPLLVAMRVNLDPILLYSCDQVRKLVDHDALQLIGVTRQMLRDGLDLLLHNHEIKKTNEWSWWVRHVPVSEQQFLNSRGK